MGDEPGEAGTRAIDQEGARMKQNQATGARRLGATALAASAALLSAAAVAAYSVAQDGDSEKGSEDGAGKPESAGPPGPLGDPLDRELSAEDREALEAFRDCMSEQGVEPPKLRLDGPPPDRGRDRSGRPRLHERFLGPPSEQERKRIERALEACEGELPEGLHPPGPPPCLGDAERGGRPRGSSEGTGVAPSSAGLRLS
jgi:hypothetical protein